MASGWKRCTDAARRQPEVLSNAVNRIFTLLRHIH